MGFHFVFSKKTALSGELWIAAGTFPLCSILQPNVNFSTLWRLKKTVT